MADKIADKKDKVIEPLAAVTNGEMQVVVDKVNEVIEHLNK